MGNKEKEVKGFWLLHKDMVIETGVVLTISSRQNHPG